MKATHSGSCQWCGRDQKLPGGRLAKHGYTVKWGFFNGVCRGAEELPFEVSCDLVKKAIEWAKVERIGYAEEIARLEKKTDEKKVPYHWYVKSERCRSTYKWIEIDVDAEKVVCDDGFVYYNYFFTNPKGERQKLDVYGARDLTAAVQQLCKSKVFELKGTLRQIEDYITYQTKRVENWKPAPLKEIKA